MRKYEKKYQGIEYPLTFAMLVNWLAVLAILLLLDTALVPALSGGVLGFIVVVCTPLIEEGIPRTTRDKLTPVLTLIQVLSLVVWALTSLARNLTIEESLIAWLHTIFICVIVEYVLYACVLGVTLVEKRHDV